MGCTRDVGLVDEDVDEDGPVSMKLLVADNPTRCLEITLPNSTSRSLVSPAHTRLSGLALDPVPQIARLQ